MTGAKLLQQSLQTDIFPLPRVPPTHRRTAAPAKSVPVQVEEDIIVLDHSGDDSDSDEKEGQSRPHYLFISSYNQCRPRRTTKNHVD